MSGEVLQGPLIQGTGPVPLGNTEFTPIKSTVFYAGEIRVKEESSQQLVDTFDASFDNVNIWNTAVTGNSGVAASWIGAAVTLASGTANSGYSYISTRNKFVPRAPAFNELGININFTTPINTTARQFWGVGNIVAAPAIPAANAFMTEGFGFEIQEGSGKMFVVTYAGGARTVIRDLSSTGTNQQPTDSNVHKYFIVYRGDFAFWAIDNRDNIVAVMPTGAQGPNVNTLPVCVASVNTATGTASAVVQVNAVWMGDTGRNNAAVSDGAYPWRIQTVYPSGGSYMAQVNTEGQRSTYRYTVLGFTPVATPTAFAVIQGSATKVTRIKRVEVSGIAPTTGGNQPFLITRRSTAGTLGSAVLTAITAAKHDTNDAAATAVISTVGTANYTTLGTANGQLAVNRIGVSVLTSGVPDSPVVYEMSRQNDKPWILRGTSDFLTLEMNGVAVPTGSIFDIEVETEEDTY